MSSALHSKLDARARQLLRALIAQYIAEHGDDMPEITGWQWGRESHGSKTGTSTEGDNV